MDIGCATGDFTDLLSKRISQPESVLGVDFVESAVARARQRFPHINFVRASISSLAETYDRQFDVVSCLEVLYYLERDQQSQALKSIKRVLRNKGYAIFSSFISTPPYFTTAQLMDLISCEFEVVATEVLHLKIINFVEMIGRRVDKLALMISGGKVNGVAARIFGRVPFSTVGALEKLSKSISVRSASHTIVLARVVD